MLDSALFSPLQTFDSEELYPSVIAKIARIAYGIISNHPFVDGNKRMGTYIMLILLELNHINVNFDDNDIVQIGVEVASGKMSYKVLLNIIIDNLK